MILASSSPFRKRIGGGWSYKTGFLNTTYLQILFQVPNIIISESEVKLRKGLRKGFFFSFFGFENKNR